MVVCISPLSGRDQLRNTNIEADSESVYHEKDGTVVACERSPAQDTHRLQDWPYLNNTEVSLSRRKLVATYDYRHLDKEAKTHVM